MGLSSDHTSPLYLFQMPLRPGWATRTWRRPVFPEGPRPSAPGKTGDAGQSSQASFRKLPEESCSGQRSLQENPAKMNNKESLAYNRSYNDRYDGTAKKGDLGLVLALTAVAARPLVT